MLFLKFKSDTQPLIPVITKYKLNCQIYYKYTNNLKFQVDRELEFPGTDTNSSVSDLTYRNDVFSFLSVGTAVLLTTCSIICSLLSIFM